MEKSFWVHTFPWLLICGDLVCNNAVGVVPKSCTQFCSLMIAVLFMKIDFVIAGPFFQRFPKRQQAASKDGHNKESWSSAVAAKFAGTIELRGTHSVRLVGAI